MVSPVQVDHVEFLAGNAPGVEGAGGFNEQLAGDLLLTSRNDQALIIAQGFGHQLWRAAFARAQEVAYRIAQGLHQRIAVIRLRALGQSSLKGSVWISKIIVR